MGSQKRSPSPERGGSPGRKRLGPPNSMGEQFHARLLPPSNSAVPPLPMAPVAAAAGGAPPPLHHQQQEHGGGGGMRKPSPTCFSCYSSHAKCSRQVPCERCTRLGLLCIPNPRKQGRPLASAHIRLDNVPPSSSSTSSSMSSSSPPPHYDGFPPHMQEHGGPPASFEPYHHANGPHRPPASAGNGFGPDPARPGHPPSHHLHHQGGARRPGAPPMPGGVAHHPHHHHQPPPPHHHHHHPAPPTAPSGGPPQQQHLHHGPPHPPPPHHHHHHHPMVKTGPPTTEPFIAGGPPQQMPPPQQQANYPPRDPVVPPPGTAATTNPGFDCPPPAIVTPWPSSEGPAAPTPSAGSITSRINGISTTATTAPPTTIVPPAGQPPAAMTAPAVTSTATAGPPAAVVPAPLPSQTFADPNPATLAQQIAAAYAEGRVIVNKAKGVILAWHYWNLRQRRDTTRGLIYSMGSAVRIDVNALSPTVPAMPTVQFQAGQQALFRRLEPLWCLSRDRAVCAVSICGGSLVVSTSARFEAMFMSQTAVHAAVSSQGLWPHHIWARLAKNQASLDAYWRLVSKATFEADPATSIMSETITVVDSYGVSTKEMCSLGVYSSPDGVFSYAWIILQPVVHKEDEDDSMVEDKDHVFSMNRRGGNVADVPAGGSMAPPSSSTSIPCTTTGQDLTQWPTNANDCAAASS